MLRPLLASLVRTFLMMQLRAFYFIDDFMCLCFSHYYAIVLLLLLHCCFSCSIIGTAAAAAAASGVVLAAVALDIVVSHYCQAAITLYDKVHIFSNVFCILM